MTFEEFLWAKGYDTLSEMLANCEWDSLNVLDYKLQDILRQYYYVGGMPEVVLNWVEKEDVLAVRRNQNRIIAAYANDISKHAGQEAERIRMVWQSIPAQLAKENKKFIYGAVKKGGRAKEFELAIQWLIDAGLAYKVYNSKKPVVPLKFYEDFDAFKLFALDVGLLGAMANAPASLMLTSNDVFKEFKGAFSENYVLEQLITIDNLSIDYFSKENSKLEIDFLVQQEERIIPIEVKAEENLKSKSLSQFVTIDHADKNLKGLRCSMKPYIDQGWMENIPLYSVLGYFKKQLKRI
jgi:predicted AAA+ superfamily ATPase